MIKYMYSPADIAEQVGVSRQAVARVAREIGVGIIARNRLVAVPKEDAARLKKAIHPKPGKPPRKS